MIPQKGLPVFNISHFEDYNHCMEFDRNFYVRPFNDHISVNHFIEKPHSHDFYLVLLITRGSGVHNIDFKEYKVEPGAMFVLIPGQVHQWSLSEDTDGFVLFFTRDYFLLDFNHDRLRNLPFFNSAFGTPYLLLDPEQQESVSQLYEKINDEYQRHQLSYHEMIRLYLNVMLVELYRYHKLKHESKYDLAYNYDLIQLNRFESLVDEYFKTHEGLPFYADKMSLSLKQLSYLCKKTVNKTPSEIIIDRIILEAKRLIIHSDMSISSIAVSLNYNDNSYFIRMFKKACGQTPDQFRYSYADAKRRLQVFHDNKNVF